jgi:TolB-like protein
MSGFLAGDDRSWVESGRSVAPAGRARFDPFPDSKDLFAPYRLPTRNVTLAGQIPGRGVGNFFAELKRRQMYRVAAAYAVVAWLLLQLVNNVAPILDLPPWVARTFLLALVTGFPLALLFVWMRDLSSADATATKPATMKLDYVLAGALIVVIGLVSYQQLSSVPAEESVQDSGSSPSPAGKITIAVLPFENLSGDPAQKFFSDGMTEEITAALAKIPNLLLVGRQSLIEDDQKRDFAVLRQALGVTYVIGGSVRRDGDRVRITAQLVQTDRGVNVWTENYDRQLTSVFATQEDIARAIAGALRVPLGLQQGESLVANRTGDLESYQQFLRARALYRARDLTQAIMLLESTVLRDPEYAPAWALLSVAQGLVANRDPDLYGGSIEDARSILDSALEKSERAAREAMRLDPKYPGSLAAQARIEIRGGRPAVGDDLFRQALALDPSDPDILDRFSQFLAGTGRVRETLQLREQLRSLEPFVPFYNIVTAQHLQRAGQNEAAIAILEAIPPLTGDELGRMSRAVSLARAYSELGRYAKAVETLLAMRSGLVSSQFVENAVTLLREAPTKVSAPEMLPELGVLNFVYVHVGAPERVLDVSERSLQIRRVAGFADWSPAFAPVRKSERFKAYVRRSGLLDYWRAKGWPDLCRPVGADDFICD